MTNGESVRKIPDSRIAAVDFLEDELREETAFIEASAPEIDAPLGEQIEFARKVSRLAADNEFLIRLRENIEFTSKLSKLTKPETDT